MRGLIAAYASEVWMVVPVQMLDGIGAGLLGVATPGIVARMLNGTGHINVGLGAVMTVQGIGASLSPTLAGLLAVSFGYSAAFLGLTVAALVALGIWLAFRAGMTAASATAKAVP